MIKKICNKTDLCHYIRLLGPIAGQEKINTFLNSDIFVLPTYAENMPNTLLEAMAAGLPVITTPVGAIPELIEDRENGFLINQGDYKSLANKIENLRISKKSRLRMGKKNIKIIRNKYDFGIVANKLDHIYKYLKAN